MAYFVELEEEHNKAMAEVDIYLSEETVELNDQLRELNVPVLILPKNLK